MQSRSPVVTILGHVDHGKTSLLDYIRSSRLAAKEHGGITQRIGAYEIDTGVKDYKTSKITFIDTPGHEAFSKLRARGAQVADIAVLVIDAKDSLMPQTIESIYHIKEAKIPLIVALNKMDLPDANPNKVKNDLLQYEVMTEDKGGQVPALEISAKTGKGVQELLETILLQAADMNLTYDPEADPQAYIIEAKKDKRGITPSAIMKQGVLRTGDMIFAEEKKAKIRTMLNDLGVQIKEVYPSTPFQILGFEEMPEVGAIITSAATAQTNLPPDAIARTINMEDLYGTPKPEEKKLSLIIKADSQGSLEAIIGSFAKNTNIKMILSTVGDINRSDIFLAKTTKAIVIGFGVSYDAEVRELAKQERVVIKSYNIIYELLEELHEVSRLLKEKEEKEKSMKGEAKILAHFMIEGERIYGVKITKGKMNLGDSIELRRGTELIGKTKLISLKNRAKNVTEAKKEQEAGMVFSPPIDMKIGDVIKSIL